MAEINYTPEFKRNYKKLKRKHYNMQKLKHVIELLQHEDFQVLRNSYDDHFLHGKWEAIKLYMLKKIEKVTGF
ncbi:type II toxin-antitoxin system mRNA interferase toxin, RelE/StbE family [Lactobacillus jensenii]|uniref:type II toxin-antitoxin system RelE/ParE family toxin n=1 Tax=Lactobacillus jensenii TaxID=109790 RepID=UPI00336A48F2